MIEKETGEIKLVDFGFAKDLTCHTGVAQDRTFTKCGTPGYTAPEVLLQTEGSNEFNIHAATPTPTTIAEMNESATSPNKTSKFISSSS